LAAGAAIALPMSWQVALAAPPATTLKGRWNITRLPTWIAGGVIAGPYGATVCVAVYYRIGFRVEPRDRTGFAHLFEHMMFQARGIWEDGVHQTVQQNGES